MRLLRSLLRAYARRLLRLCGKPGGKVAAVFAANPGDAQRAVLHLSKGAKIPLWLFTTEAPLPETVALCSQVVIEGRSWRLILGAGRELRSEWFALGVAAWTGENRRWLLKFAPFLIPPFRVLVLNEHGDFFPGSPGAVARHVGRRLRDHLHSTWNGCRDLGGGYWRLLTYHIWRAGPVRRVKDEAAGILLLSAAWLLRACGNPHRWIFRRLPRLLPSRDALRAHEEAVGPDYCATVRTAITIDRFFPQRPVWDGEAFEDFARRSDARWILWLERPDMPAETDDLVLLMQDPRAFAASRQRHFRGWKGSLLPAAPFRALQSGEATAVLAPLSDAILVDREKLLEAGVPRCGLPGAAWMLLFWKAAAAGWNSYSAGPVLPAGPVREQPDLPVVETSVFLQVASDPLLRRLAPPEPNLARGNIAFAPALQSRRAPSRPTVLLVSPFLPYPLSHGGAVRIYNLCRALAGRVDFLLATMRESHETVDYGKLHEVFRQVWVVDHDEAPARDGRLPAQVRQYQSQSMRALIAEVARQSKPDVLQIEYTHMAGFRDAAPEIPAILVEHDLTFSLYRQLAERRPSPKSRREYLRWLEFERYWLEKFDVVWTVSEEDRLAAMRAGGRTVENTWVIPNGVDLERFRPVAEGPAEGRTEGRARPEILYVGSFRHFPNLLGFERLRSEIMPRVWRCFPEAVLRVVAGPEHERFWMQFAGRAGRAPLDRRIQLHGFVEDLRPLYAQATVVAVPLEVSAGTNIKVMEAMAAGGALVTTPAGCAGLALEDGADALIRAEAHSFADALTDLLAAADLRRSLAAKARRTVEERFGWTAIGDTAYKTYLALGLPELAER